ncbi:hypothetical protein [Paenibacillus sp. TH7-28]
MKDREYSKETQKGGHENIATTQIYTHVMDEVKERAMNKIRPAIPFIINKEEP